MNRRTFETLAKYIAETNRTRVMFDYPGEGACASPKTGEIHMPGSIASHNALAALALLMHEAAHIKYSTRIPEDLCKDPVMKDVINAIEDARIDMHNFGKLDNIKGFYERMYRDHKKPDPAQVPLPVKLLINQILSYEDMARFKYKDNDTTDWERTPKGGKLKHLFYEGVSAIEYDNWPKLEQAVKDIIKILKMTKPFNEMMAGGDLKIEGAMQGGMPGQGQPGQVKAKGEGEGEGEGEGDKTDKDGKPGLGHDPTYYDHIDVIDAILHPKSILGKGSMDGFRGDQIGPAALQEQTRQKFKDLLNMKTRVRRDDGGVLDVDNLISYYTGDIETLFMDEIIKHEKRSKILILMDCSGSMNGQLIDKKDRRRALVSCVKAVTEVLDEVIELEGVNVDYDLAAFNSEYYKLDKDSWEKDYMQLSGGTNFHRAFHQAITDLAGDNSIDGRKMIVCFTDGDVSDEQIRDVKHDIITYGSDVRAMIIGIGTDPCSKMSQDIVGDNIILAEENADLVLLETIGEML